MGQHRIFINLFVGQSEFFVLNLTALLIIKLCIAQFLEYYDSRYFRFDKKSEKNF